MKNQVEKISLAEFLDYLEKANSDKTKNSRVTIDLIYWDPVNKQLMVYILQEKSPFNIPKFQMN